MAKNRGSSGVVTTSMLAPGFVKSGPRLMSLYGLEDVCPAPRQATPFGGASDERGEDRKLALF